MNLRRYAFFVVAGIATTMSAQANEGPAAGKIALICPGRSVRNADIEMAAKAANWRISPEQALRMREHARSVCAANLSIATLLAPEDFGGDREVVYEPTR
jgi:hypothetical protein